MKFSVDTAYDLVGMLLWWFLLNRFLANSFFQGTETTMVVLSVVIPAIVVGLGAQAAGQHHRTRFVAIVLAFVLFLGWIIATAPSS